MHNSMGLVNIVQVSVSTGVLIVVLLAVRSHLHTRYSARLLCLLWALLALRLLLPVQLTWPAGAVQVELPGSGSGSYVVTMPAEVSGGQPLEPIAGAAVQKSSAQVPVGQILFAIWAAAATAAALWQVAGYGLFAGRCGAAGRRWRLRSFWRYGRRRSGG